MRRRFFLVIVLITIVGHVEAAIPSRERQALVALYESAYGPYWYGGNAWPVSAAGTECSWTGVTCNDAQTTVVALDLTRAGLWGTIPPELSQLGSLTTLILWDNYLYGPIPTELDRLTNLEYLDLSHNWLSGPIPPSFSKLSRLEQLWLENNALNGPIPSSLGTIYPLEVLSLSSNELTGEIPPALWDARFLLYVDLQSNELTGAVPPGIGALGFLETLDLSQNQFAGPIPWWDLPRTLSYLSLGQNYFSIDGPLPSEIGQFRNLTFLGLDFLGFTSIPAEIGLLENLVHLDLAGNWLENVPPELGQLQNLETLDLSFNSFDSIPSVVTNFPALTTFRFGWNFASALPPGMSLLGSLESLYLDGNYFEEIPVELRNLPSLAILDMSWNSLESADFTSGFHNLGEIYLSYNFLTQFPAAAPPGLRLLDLTANYISGPLPSWLGTLSSLESLSLWQNEFEGPVPDGLRHLRSLTYLDLGWNRFSGPVPAWLNELTNLDTLYLDFNRLEGSIPNLNALQNLTLLGLNDNRLGGAVPVHLSGLERLEYLLLYGNRFEGAVPREFAAMNLEWLDLSGNFLTGAVPAEYGTSGIRYLFLEKNNLRGAVPETFREREYLYTNLEHNALTASPQVAEILQVYTYFLETQTIPPSGVTVTPTPYTADVRWNPIAFTDGGGGYQIQLSTSPGGPYTPVLTTNDKGEEGATVTGLNPSTRYYGVIKTVSYPFSEGTLQQLNRIFSDATPEFTFVTGAATQSPARVAVTSRPRGMVQAPGVAGGADSYTLTNVGGMATTVSVSTTDAFFTQSPTQFTLQPGQSTGVSLSGVAVPEGSYRGTARVSGTGVPAGLTVPVSLLSLEPPDEEPVVRAVSSRIDLSAPAEENPVAEVVYENISGVKFSGILVSDVEFLVPPNGLVEIEPNARVTVEVVTDRSKRPDAALLAGTAIGKVFLLSLGEKNPFGKGPVAAAETTSTTLVTVVDTVKPKISEASLTPLAPGEIAFVLPHVGHVTSSSGIYISDVTILNGSTGKVSSPEMFYRPLNPAHGPPTAAALPTLVSKALVSYGDVVTSVFDKKEQVGTLILRGVTEQTSIVASIFNSSDPRGLYGTTIPAFRSDRAISNGGELVLTGLRKNTTQYTNLFLQEARGDTAIANVVFVSADGNTLGTQSRELAPFSLIRINGAEVPDGSVAARITNSGGGGLVAYATPVDQSLDNWTLADWSQIYGTDPGGRVIIPVGGAAAGANNTDFRTDVVLTNRCTEVVDPRAREDGQNSGATCTAKIAEVAVRYVSGGQSYAKTIELPLGNTVELNDIVRGLFGIQGNSIGYFEIEPNFGSLAVASRTYNLLESGLTFGSSVPALGSTSAIRLGQSRVMPGLEDSKRTTQEAGIGGTRRTNFGLVEVGGAPIRVRVAVSFTVNTSALAKTSVQHSRVFDLPGGGFMNLSRIVSTVMGEQRDQLLPDLNDVTAEFTVVEGEGALMIYTSSVDNGTADSVIRIE